MADDGTNRSAIPDASTEVSGKPSSTDLPDRIGSYRILEQLGEGGFAVVYLAEQTEPVRRRVALKLIKPGMDSRQVIVRFEAERQALAMMDHPNVAKVFDAGVTPPESGSRPYFVMEHVAGVPITEHCDKQRLSIDQRLNLFMQVCHAVQHAHQKGIIHRDLKPTNILVSVRDGEAVPKVIDFGVAKALHQKLTEKTLYTEQGQLIGTPEYMSPEQAEMTAQDIDTRSDIYSLGVLLYELLTGALPFDPTTLREAAFGEIQRIIREIEPAKPSTKLSSLGDQSTTSAEKRRLDTQSLTRELRGDLDWIVMKALEKDRERRYETANGLAMDLRRHLDHEPVLASPPSAAYRMRKFIRRNRTGVLAGAVVAVALVAATGVSIGFALSEAEQRRLAEEKTQEASDNLTLAERREEEATRELMRANAVVALIDDLFSSADPHKRKGPGYTVRLLLDDFEGTIGDQFEGQPLVEASIRHTVGKAYLGLGLPDEAEPHLQVALDLRTHVLGEHDPIALQTRRSLVYVHHDRGEHAEAERRIRGLLEQFSDVEDPDSVQLSLTDSLADMLRHQGRYDEAESLHLKTLEIRKRVLGDEHLDTLFSMNSLANLYSDQGRYDEAETLIVKTLETRKRALGDEDPNTLVSMFNLALLYVDQGRYDEAEPLFVKTLETEKRILGDEHPDTLSIMNDLAYLYMNQGRYDEAEPLYLETLEIRKRVLGDEHRNTLGSITNLGNLYLSMDRFDDARALFERSLPIKRRVLGMDDPWTQTALGGLARAYEGLHRRDEAEPLYLETLEIRRRVLGDEHPDTLGSMNNLAMLYMNQGRYDEAEPLYLETLEIKRRVLGDEHPDTLGTMNNLAMLYENQGRYDEAETLIVKTLEIKRRVLGDEHRDTLGSITNLGALYLSMNRFDDARAMFERSLPIKRRVLGMDHPWTRNALWGLARAYDGLDRSDEAEPLYLEMLEIKRRVLGDEHPDTLDTMNNLAIQYMNQGRYDEAEPLYLETLEIRKRVLGDEHRDTLGSITNLGALYLSMKRFDDARAMYERSLPIKRRVLGMGHPWTRYALGGLARAYDGLEQFDDALSLWRELQEFQLAQAEDPDASAQALNAAAWDLLTNEHPELRDPARALPLAQRAVDKAGGDDPAILDTLALAQHLTGDTAAAIETEKKALSLLPADAPGRGDYEAALARFEASLKDDETERESDADQDN